MVGYLLGVLFNMATLVAIRHNTLIKNFYKRLREKGKLGKVALVACMRKLVTIHNQMVMHDNLWQDNKKIKA